MVLLSAGAAVLVTFGGVARWVRVVGGIGLGGIRWPFLVKSTT